MSNRRTGEDYLDMEEKRKRKPPEKPKSKPPAPKPPKPPKPRVPKQKPAPGPKTPKKMSREEMLKKIKKFQSSRFDPENIRTLPGKF